jgi:hypothetical protein
MEKLISVNHNKASFSSQSSTADVELTMDERDIVCYVGGFVLFRSKKLFSNNEQCLLVVNHTIKGDGELFTGKLRATKTRGGLCEPKAVMISFFELCESIFRHMFAATENHSLQFCINYVCCTDDVVSLFYTCTYFHDVHVKSQENVLMHILSCFFFT